MKKILKNTKANEALSPDEIIAKGNAHAEIDRKRREEEEAKKREQTIKSIWIKEIHTDSSHSGKDYADLEITKIDGTVESYQFNVASTGVPEKWTGNADDFSKNRNGGNDHFISGDAYKSANDPLYKSILADLKRSPSFRKYKIEPTDMDVKISMIRAMFSDRRIEWFYGKNKISDSLWAFGREMPVIEKNPLVRNLVSKNMSQSKGRAIYTSGNTKIYKLDI